MGAFNLIRATGPAWILNASKIKNELLASVASISWQITAPTDPLSKSGKKVGSPPK
jgi:hypothetical protein